MDIREYVNLRIRSWHQNLVFWVLFVWVFGLVSTWDFGTSALLVVGVSWVNGMPRRCHCFSVCCVLICDSVLDSGAVEAMFWAVLSAHGFVLYLVLRFWGILSCLLRILKWFLKRVLQRFLKEFSGVFCVWRTKILVGRVDGIRGCDDIPGWSGALPRLWSWD